MVAVGTILCPVYVLCMQGFGGGNQIEGNLMANIGRGWNKDEGVINAWVREPWILSLSF